MHQPQNAGTNSTDIQNRGAFLTRKTHKSYSQTAVDLSLEQNYNRDTASLTQGIVTLRNSESAMRRWALARSQTTREVTKLRSISGPEQNENPSDLVHNYRVRKGNERMQALTIEDFGSPFSSDLSCNR